MPLIAHTKLPSFDRIRREGREVLSAQRAQSQDIRELHIGILNMMPDAALQATERQFLRLLDSCNRVVQIYAHLFTMPGIARQGAALEHVHAYYESFEDIQRDGLDALIITGANPVCPDIRDEPYWSDLLEVMDWANDNVTSTLCSCLSSHARIAHTFGVDRVPLSMKQWGVYSHRVVDREHPLTATLNTRFDAPHSRWNNVPRAALESVGIKVLAESEEAGVHLAVSPDGLRWIFLQGHPEYDVESLPKEYKREVVRYQDGTNEDYPPYPEHCFTAGILELLDKHRARAETARATHSPQPAFPDAEVESGLENSWTDTGKSLFNNWLGLIYQLTHSERGKPFMDGIDPADPLELNRPSG